MNPVNINAVGWHYDKLSIFYGMLSGQPIHHRFWRNGESSNEAQVKLIEELDNPGSGVIRLPSDSMRTALVEIEH